MNWEYYRDLIVKDGHYEEDWYIIGIDFGTTNSVISYWHKGHNCPVPIDMSHGFGKIPMPSVVQYRHEGNEEEWIVGEEALRSMKLYPDSTIYSIKRKMGQNTTYSHGGKDYVPETISAKIIESLVNEVSHMNPNSVLIGVVVSVPYDFDDAAKKATIRACQLAGLADNLICLIEEPKAAALAYNFRQALKKDEKIMVYDFGGGTLDITVFEVVSTKGDTISMKVISEGGESYHGGDNIDELLLEHLYEWVTLETGKKSEDLAAENQAELMIMARDYKERLSGVKQIRVPFSFLIPPFAKKISREEFESIISKFVKKTRTLVQRTLREASDGKIDPSEISRILLEGGSSSMPWVRTMLVSIFNDEDIIYSSEKPALDISIGATYYAAMKLGVLSHQDIKTFGKRVDFEVTVPHDIGFLMEFDCKQVFHTMIGRGTPYSLAKKTQIFTLSGDTDDEMTTLEITILERMNKGDTAEKCHLIGHVHVKDLPKRPSGKTHLKVTLSMEEEGGMVKGQVEDLGYLEEYESSGFKVGFVPSRHESVTIEAE